MPKSPHRASPLASKRRPADKSTPQRPRTGAALNDLVSAFEAECHLGLQVREETWSPSQNGNSLPDKVFGQIKRCYFSSEPALRRTLNDFKINAVDLPQKERLELLHQLLRSQISSPPSTRGTGLHTPQDGLNKPLRSQDSVQLSQPSDLLPTTTGDPDSPYTTALEILSFTDDEEDYAAPPSPTLSIKSAQNRAQASPYVSLGPVGRKRPLDSSFDGPNSLKLTKTSEGRQSPESHLARPRSMNRQAEAKSLFKKPSLEMARSYRINSVQTSFNSDTVWSSQQTVTDASTPMSSFSSDLVAFQSTTLNKTKTSSTTVGSLDDKELLELDSKLELEQGRQLDDLTRESSATFRSLDRIGRATVEQAISERTVTSPTGTISEINSSKHWTPPTRPISPSSSSHDGRPPMRFALGSPYSISPSDSPSRISHHIRDIPSQNLFISDIPESLKKFPYHILFICCRIAIEHNVPMPLLMEAMDEAQVAHDPELFWNDIKRRLKGPINLTQESTKIWATANGAFDSYTFKGKVIFNHQRSKPVFGINLLPLQKENSCRFQRKFGADRFLYLNFPSFEPASKPERFSRHQMTQIQQQWAEWLRREHSFLSRRWRAFHVEPIKRGKGARRNDSENYGTRVILFATEGLDIQRPLSIGEMIDWFFPFGVNQDQTFCKASARLDLGLSKTTPTLIFKPSQIRRVEDIRANGTPEDTQFNDIYLKWESITDRPVMNDGCALMSLGAAQEIWRLYKKETGRNDRIPTVFQARIGGAKGLWFVRAESYSQNTGGSDIWIEISDSQLKFQPHPDDLSDESYDPARLAFELVDYSSSPALSDLHVSFISIMVDRGVPLSTIENIIIQRLDRERNQLLAMLLDPVGMYGRIHKQGAGSQSSEGMLWQAALPLVLGDRIKLLLESGFSPTEEPYLGQTICRFINKQQLWEEAKLRIPLGKATFLYGIADPLGVLAPGEIHVQFSTWFIDEMTEESYLCLDGIEVLVARQPACRRSDLQKVRALSHPKLGYLVDVVVFPTQGQCPLAGKLQGGDYDGDIFWVCWEPELVSPFKNAQPPIQPPDPAQYGIRQNKTKVRDVMTPHDPSSVDGFLREALSFRTSPSLLGRVTNYLEKQAYTENRISSRTIDALCDMHDLLVDASKQGYEFTDSEFDAAKKRLGLLRNPNIPAYKAAMECCANAKDVDEADKIRSKQWPSNLNPKNTVDHLYFNVVRKHNAETRRRVKEVLSKERGDDSALRFPYLHEQQKKSQIVEHEMNQLLRSFKAILHEWNSGMKRNEGNSTADEYNATVIKCYQKYRELIPNDIENPEIKRWVEPCISESATYWETLRASALYTVYPERPAFVFHMAGKELADLKCPTYGSRRICGPIFSILKPKIKNVVRQPEVEDTSSEDEVFDTLMERGSEQF